MTEEESFRMGYLHEYKALDGQTSGKVTQQFAYTMMLDRAAYTAGELAAWADHRSGKTCDVNRAWQEEQEFKATL
jgi:hypothetical protein